MRILRATFPAAGLAALLLAACSPDSAPDPAGPASTSDAALDASSGHAATVEVFATGLNFPRGITFGPRGELYVAEAGSAGTASTTEAECTQVGAPIGPYHNGPTGRVSRIDRHGNRTTVADGFPSGVNSFGDVLGVADVAWSRGKLYALVAGGGCSHGVADVPAGVARVHSNGTWSMVSDLSAYQAANPVANPFPPDFEPDGSWYGMISSWGKLIAVEPNHGEVVRVDPRTGDVERIADLSATQGHIVPTVVAERRGALYVSSLGVFPLAPGSVSVLRISRGGSVSVVADGFTGVLGLDFDRRGRLYVLETSSVAGFPTPGTGRVVRLDRHGDREVIVDGLFLPAGLKVGPDGNLYISNKGFGPPQPGEILRVRIRGGNDYGHHDEDMEQDGD